MALALQQLEQRLLAWARDRDRFFAVLLQAFGSEATSPDADTLRTTLFGEGLTISLEVLPLPGLLAAYAAATPTAAEVVLLDEAWLAVASADDLEAVLLEELGHAIDQRLNGPHDRPGDEGEIFSSLLRGITPSPESGCENDQRWIAIGNNMRVVEGADPSTVVPLNVSSVLLSDGIINRVDGVRDNTQDSLDGSGFVLITQTEAEQSGLLTPVGLPDDGFFAENAFHPNIQLPYRNSDNGINARVLSTDGQYFDLSGINLNISELHLAAFSANGTGQLKVTFTYTDGTTGSGQFAATDWYSEITQTKSHYYLIDGMDRANLSGIYYNDSDAAVFGFRLLPNSGKTVESIRVQKVGSSAKVVFLGATVVKASPAVALAGTINPVFTASSIGYGLGNVGSFASPSFADVDGDGDLDAYIGGFNGNTLFFRNTGTETSPGFGASTILGLTNLGGYASPALADIDNDGDLDAFVGNGDGLLYFFRNTGLSTGPAFAANSLGFGLPDVGNRADPCLADIDGDLDLDLFVGNSEGNLLLFTNTGTLTNPLFSGASSGFVPDVGSNAAPSLVDIDGDGDLDLFIGNSSGSILFFRNTGTASSAAFAASSIGFGMPNAGASANPTFVDIDSDGDLDAFIGNSNGISLVHRNIGTEGLRSITPDGSYGVSAVISIQVPFTEIVTVSGTPTLLLETGSIDRTATYTGGSGTNILSFQYTVQAGDASSDLDLASTSALQLDGGTIRDATSNNAILTLPAPGATGSLAANAALQIDGVEPMVAPEGLSSSTANGTYGPDAVITIQVPFSEAVTVNTASGTPTLLLETGGTDRKATYIGGSGTASLSFQYTVQAGDASSDLDFASTTALEFNGATIRDAVGNNANLTLPAPGTTGSLAANAALQIDGVAPMVAAAGLSSSTADGTYGLDAVITIQVPFSEAVTVDTASGTPTLLLETGSIDRKATYIGGSGTATLSFQYTVQAGDASSDLDFASTTALELNGATMRDAAGNNADLTLSAPGATGSLAANAALHIDGVAPMVAPGGLSSSTADGTYGLDAVITIQVPFSEAVTVNTASGTPTLLLETGGTDRRATYIGGSGTASLSFQYTVQAGDASSDLDFASITALELNGAIMRDVAGNNANLTLPAPGATGSLAANAALQIDGVAPILSGSTPADNASGVNEFANLQLSFSESVYADTGAIELRRANGTLLESFDGASGMGSAGGSVAVIGSTLTLDPFAALSSSTAYYLTIAPTAIRDGVNNAFAGINEATTLNFSTGDSIAPVLMEISTTSANGTYGAGAVISLTVRFSEAVTVTFHGGVPSLLLETGTTDRPANYISGSGSNILSFAYTVQSGDSAADLDVASPTALQLNGGSIRDAAGNDATLTLPAAGSSGSLGANADLVINGATIQSLTLTTATPRVSEGSTISATLSSSTLAPGSTLYWSLSGPGITAADFTLPDLMGSLILGSDRRASFSRAIALDGVSEPDEQLTLRVFSDAGRSLSLAAIQFTLRDLTATGVSGATDDRDLIIGTSGDETISGVPAGSLLNGRGSYDTLTGNGGNDTFVLASSSSVFYNDSQAASSGLPDLAAITDFAAGDRIQLKGAASEYRLSNATLSGISGTLLSWRASAGAGTLDEAIGFLQGVSNSTLSLSNSSQFLYV
ncbi:MAG: FG-GAP-like repeat-containing protein [Cyanobacteriota bacterium]|nr:FG-GAP-like repeat-containing protein [Cyanobacteriota bacterium]